MDPVYRNGEYYDNGEQVSWDYVLDWLQTHNGISATYSFSSNSSGNVHLNKTTKGYNSNTFYLDGKKYKANSYMTLMGRDDNNNNVGDFSGIRTIDKNDIYEILGNAAYIIYDLYHNNVEGAMLGESGLVLKTFWGLRYRTGGLLDYKNSVYKLLNINSKSLLQINGITYNPNEAGNFIWGMVLEYFGVLIDTNYAAEKATRGRHDEPWEQRAISVGRNYGKLLLKQTSKTDQDIILRIRLENRSY